MDDATPPAGPTSSVYVVTEDGSLLDAAAYAASLVHDAPVPDGPAVALEKASRQVEDRARGSRWVEPRLSYDALLGFLDWNTWHRRCCVVKSVLVSGLGWVLERGGEPVYDSLTREGEMGDPAVRLLTRPSPDEPTLTLDGLLFRFLLDYHAVGDGYLEVVYDGAGRAAELYHAPARTMRRGVDRGVYYQVKAGRTERFRAFGASGGGRARDAAGRFARGRSVADGTSAAQGGARSEVLHLYEYDPRSDDYGMPGWVGALASMGLDRTVLEFNTRLFQNSLMAHLAVVVEGGRLSPEGRDALRRFVKERATGVENAGRILLLEDEDDRVKIRFERLNLDVKDLMLTGIQSHFRDVVIGAHGVPPRVLGVVTTGQLGATGEVEGQLQTFREVVVRPQQRTLEDLLGLVLDTVDVEARYRVRFREMDVTALQADSALLSVLLQHGVLRHEHAARIAETLLR